MDGVMRSLARVPWAYIFLFNLAALTAVLLALALLINHASGGVSSADAITSDKRIAFSFDDTPRGTGGLVDLKKRPDMLVAALHKGGVEQAVFFANPGRIDANGPHASTIPTYGAAGHLVANHTNTHKPLSRVSAQTFLADIDAAEIWLKKQPTYRPWFRFPQLDEGGRNKAKRDAVRAGLKERGLRYGYVTIDGSDWMTEGLVSKAVAAGQTIDRDALRDLYVETHVKSAELSNQLARRILGRAPAQMLLLHDTDLAALYVDDLAKALKAKGWTIVTADIAFADPLLDRWPDTEIANGNLLQMLATERSISGSRFFERNDRDVARRLFNERVLKAKPAMANKK